MDYGREDLNDTVTVELTEWGATYLNARNMHKNKTDTENLIYKTDYKEGDVYKGKLWQLILDFKEKEIKLSKMKNYGKGCDYGIQ